jgi:hypothetical protein
MSSAKPGKAFGAKSRRQVVDTNLLPDEVAIRKQQYAHVMKVVPTLSARDQKYLTLRFGLKGQDPHTQKQMGEILFVTEGRARQIEHEIIKKIHRALGDEMYEAFHAPQDRKDRATSSFREALLSLDTSGRALR